MSIALYRVDDRLIHGQVVVGWGKPLHADFIVLVDDRVRASPWEQELYRMGVPPGLDVEFASVAEARQGLERWEHDPRVGILLTGDVATIAALVHGGHVPRINLGGVHARDGRRERLRFIYLSDDEAETLRRLARSGVQVTAQDVPTARAVPLEEFL
ncbi:MAG TPA: PTS sugar transporter subunit IIB [Gemmatimonadales bacterium]|nr:PTS sugar transporter subunit IIB [Gemmatimonadales bacterium]